MSSLLEIVTATKQVAVCGVSIEVYGVSAKGVAHLLGKYPELRKLMTGLEVEFEALLEMGGDVVAAIIAAGCGFPGNKEAEDKAEKLSLGEQADLITAIVELTLPNGVGPFIEQLQAMGARLELGEPQPEAPVTKLHKQSKAS